MASTTAAKLPADSEARNKDNMPRLSAPTRRTFMIAATALVLGIVTYTGWLGIDVSTDLSFGLTAAGGLILALGTILNRL